MQTDIAKVNGLASIVDIAAIDQFAARINQPPKPSEMKKDPKGFDYLPASFIQMELDEIFLGLWSWEVRSIQVVANEILVAGDLKIFHPITGQWIVRSGVGAAIIRQKKDSATTDIDGKIKDAITMDLPHAETDAFKNAAKKLGKRFGRDLNRKFVDEYTSQTEAEEPDDERQRISALVGECTNIADLTKLYRSDPRHANFADLFSERKNQLA